MDFEKLAEKAKAAGEVAKEYNANKTAAPGQRHQPQ
jgi:hypothetical protein